MNAMDAVLEMIRQGVIEVRLDGTVWKLRNLNAMPLAAPRRVETKSKRGYLVVKVCIANKQFALSAHRLVWTVVNGPIPDGLDVNHKDGDRTNNSPSNLELLSRGDNHRHAYRELGRPLASSMPAPKLESMIEPAKELRAQGLSFREIGDRLGISQTLAFRAVKSK